MSKEKDNKNKISRNIDKLVMGAIIGGAVGSVVGATLAPKSGKETREYLKAKGKELYEKGKEMVHEGEEKIEEACKPKKKRCFIWRLFKR